MRPIAFCSRCRGMEVGWNRKYLTHRIVCSGSPFLALRLLAYTVTITFLISFFPTTTATVISPDPETLPEAVVQVGTESAPQVLDPAIDSIEDILGRHSRVDSVERSCIANAVVASARRYDVDPFLVASILLVESSANPFAISGRDEVGMMQIHVPTWGSLAEAEEINLFRVEDNVDLGARILKDYTRQHGLWDGVLRYLGTNGPTEEGAAYLRRVQGIYSDRLAD